MRGRGEVSNEEWAVLVRTAAALSPAGRRAGKAAAGHTRGTEWRMVDSAHGGAVAGTAQEVSTLSDRSPEFSALGAQRATEKPLRALARELHSHGLLPLEDRAYDSDPLDRRLERDYGIELIAPNRENRSRTQDRRKLRRYK
jgi:hypothetical protein